MNKTNTSDKETSFFDFDIKAICNYVHTSIYNKRDGFGFPIVNFPWLSGCVPRVPSYCVYISQLVRCTRCCTSGFDFHSKNLQITSKLLISTQGYTWSCPTLGLACVLMSRPISPELVLSPDFWISNTPRYFSFAYHKLRKTFGKFSRSYSELLSQFGDEISFQEHVSKRISHPDFYSDMKGQRRSIFLLVGLENSKRLRSQNHDPVIIERTIGQVLGSSTALHRSFLKHFTRTIWTIWRDLSKPPQRRQGPDLGPLWLSFGTPFSH